jgi:ankyrin repeat protein
MVAAQRGRLDIVSPLIDNANLKNINERDSNGRSALYYAIESNAENIDVVSMILGAGGDPTNGNEKEMIPLHAAIDRDYQKIVKLLLDQDKININQVRDLTGISI